MFSIQDPTATATDPGVPALSGPVGFFTEGSPGLVAPTNLRAWWLNMVQNELLSVLAAANVLPFSGSDSLGQLAQSIKRLAGAKYSNWYQSTAFAPDNAGFLTLDCTSGSESFTLPRAALVPGIALTFLITRVDTVPANVCTVGVNPFYDLFEPGSVTSMTMAPGDTWLMRSDGSGKWYPIPLCRQRQRLQWTAAGIYSNALVIPAGITELICNGIVGAGGGSGSSTSSVAGSGGGAGAFGSGVIPVTPGNVINLDVGQGGSGGTVGADNASAGGFSSISIGTTVVAYFGGGGAGHGNGVVGGGGSGLYSTGPSGWFTFNGNAGAPAVSGFGLSGPGGAPYQGSPVGGVAGAPGNAGIQAGSGASGAGYGASGYAGAAGAAGAIFLEY